MAHHLEGATAFDHPQFRNPAASSGLIGLVGDDSAASGSGYAVTPGIVVDNEYKTCQAPLTFDPATLDGVSKLSIQLTADGAQQGLFTHQGTASFLVPIFASTLVGSPCNGTTPRLATSASIRSAACTRRRSSRSRS